ncbi:hypothetical protein [Alteromonas lipotrueae]|uniref:hypothetical protein n=1 Tax=Alteromonas lipotrueae TaxID=2803814 RepID=UPI0035A6C7BC
MADSNRSDDWSPEQKFSVVLETASLSELSIAVKKAFTLNKLKSGSKAALQGTKLKANSVSN